jgi:hypothetical protein
MASVYLSFLSDNTVLYKLVVQCKVEMAIEVSIVAMNANYYNVYSVIRIQLCTWTTNLYSALQVGYPCAELK